MLIQSITLAYMSRLERRKIEREVQKDIVAVIASMVKDFNTEPDTEALAEVTESDYPLLEQQVHNNPLMQIQFNFSKDRFLQYMEALEIAIGAAKTFQLHQEGLLIQDKLGFKVMLDRLRDEERMRKHNRSKGFLN